MSDDATGLPPGTVWWVLAIVLFGVGDILSTAVGLTLGAVELHPIFGGLIEEYRLIAMVPLKAIAFVLSFALWRIAPHPTRIGVPIGLTLVGLPITAWNLFVIVRLL